MMAESKLDQHYLIKNLSEEKMQQLKRRICMGNCILIFTAICATAAIAVGFFLEHHFSLAWQISAHIAIIVCSVTLKIGYLLRSFSLKQLGHNNF